MQWRPVAGVTRLGLLLAELVRRREPRQQGLIGRMLHVKHDMIRNNKEFAYKALNNKDTLHILSIQ